jgi:peptide/nickel transport system ATP-binding protein
MYSQRKRTNQLLTIGQPVDQINLIDLVVNVDVLPKGTTPPLVGSPPVASVRDLHVTLHARDGAVRALRGVSLDIAPGEIVALVGESGSGKSVLGASLLGLLPASARPQVTGSVDVAGHDMVNSPDRQLRQVRKHLLGAVFQDPLTSLNPTMRIGRQLNERTNDEKRSLSRLVDAGVPDPKQRMGQFPHQLSGGLRQRVMISMALGGSGHLPKTEVRKPGATGRDPLEVEVALDVHFDAGGAPRLVVADEPTTALDVSVQAQIVLLFDRIRRNHGCAVLLITHDLGVAASIADRIAVLYAGRLCEVGPSAEILEHPSHPYTKALLSARLSLDGSRSTSDPLMGEPPNPMKPLTGCSFAPRCAIAQPSCSESAPELNTRAGGLGSVACFAPLDQEEEVTKPPMSADNVVMRTYQVDKPVTHSQKGTAPALVLDNVCKTFAVSAEGKLRRKEELRAVQEVSLTVPSHGAVALVGESGCGKTTTLRMAAGLSTPDAGHVSWAPDAGRPQLVFQDASSSLTPWITIGKQVEERFAHLGLSRTERRERARDIMQRVGLDDRAANSQPRELSGGQRQRAVIARALASGPSLLICDEPVSALDASLAVRILNLLQELRDQLGVALLVVTHDLAAARRIADTVAVMYLGRIVEEAPADQLFAAPMHPYTQGLIAASPTTEAGRLAPTLLGEPPSPTQRIVGCPFASRCPIVSDRCRRETPDLRNIDGRMVACHLAGRPVFEPALEVHQ